MAVAPTPITRPQAEYDPSPRPFEKLGLDTSLTPRARRALMHRSPFKEALTWIEIHGHAPEALEHWRGFVEAAGTYEGEEGAPAAPPARRRRRRRRRFFRPKTT